MWTLTPCHWSWNLTGRNLTITLNLIYNLCIRTILHTKWTIIAFFHMFVNCLCLFVVCHLQTCSQTSSFATGGTAGTPSRPLCQWAIWLSFLKQKKKTEAYSDVWPTAALYPWKTPLAKIMADKKCLGKTGVRGTTVAVKAHKSFSPHTLLHIQKTTV